MTPRTYDLKMGEVVTVCPWRRNPITGSEVKRQLVRSVFGNLFVVSSSRGGSINETMIFHGDNNGNVVCWEELWVTVPYDEQAGLEVAISESFDIE
jgi:hypothetical protein